MKGEKKVSNEKLRERLLAMCKTHFPSIQMSQSLVERLLDLIEEVSTAEAEMAYADGYSEGYDDCLAELSSRAEASEAGSYDSGYKDGYEDGHNDGLDDCELAEDRD
jgi:hypothetical protein